MTPDLLAPFPYFGGKRTIAEAVWARLSTPKQYIEPFCGSAAMLLAAPVPASLEVISDGSGFIANFWRAARGYATVATSVEDAERIIVEMEARRQMARGKS